MKTAKAGEIEVLVQYSILICGKDLNHDYISKGGVIMFQVNFIAGS